MIKLRYGNTNTFYIHGSKGGLLIDTDWAGTLPQFFKAIKSAGLGIPDISYVLATHYHPDHVGIIGEFQRLGVVLLVADVQCGFLHFPDEIFSRDRRLHYIPIDETAAKIIPCRESRAFLHSLGIASSGVFRPQALYRQIICRHVIPFFPDDPGGAENAGYHEYRRIGRQAPAQLFTCRGRAPL